MIKAASIISKAKLEILNDRCGDPQAWTEYRWGFNEESGAHLKSCHDLLAHAVHI